MRTYVRKVGAHFIGIRVACRFQVKNELIFLRCFGEGIPFGGVLAASRSLRAFLFVSNSVPGLCHEQSTTSTGKTHVRPCGGGVCDLFSSRSLECLRETLRGRTSLGEGRRGEPNFATTVCVRLRCLWLDSNVLPSFLCVSVVHAVRVEPGASPLKSPF